MPSPTGMSVEFLKPERRNSGSIRRFDTGSSLPEVFINAAFDYADSDTASSCPSHEYEDLQSVRTAAKTGPRRKDNALYETTLPIPRRERQITECSDVSSAYTVGSDVSPAKKESCLSKLILFLILAFSVAAFVLVLLIILGKMGPKCTCTQAESSKHPAVPRTGRAFSVQNLLKQIQDLKSNMKTMEARVHAAETFVTKHEKQTQVSAQKMIVNETANKVAAVDGVWVNMSNTHKAFELKLDTEFRLLNKSVEALNESDGDLTLKINELRRNQILTLGMSRQLAVNVTQLESRVQELKKSSNNVSSRIGSLERGYTQINTLMKILQAVNGAQNSSHVYLQSLYNSVKDSLARVNTTVNNKLKAPVSTSVKTAANFTLCEHQRIPGTPGSVGKLSVSDSAFSEADYTEPATKRVMGAACSTDYARHYQLFSPRKGFYQCKCRGVSPVFKSDNPPTIKCFLDVWECPIG